MGLRSTSCVVWRGITISAPWAMPMLVSMVLDPRRLVSCCRQALLRCLPGEMFKMGRMKWSGLTLWS